MPLPTTLAEVVLRTAERHPQRGFTFLDDDGKEVKHDYPALERLTARRASGLQALGLNPGDRIGLSCGDPETFVISFFAALRVGVVPVPLYPPAGLGGLDAWTDRTASILDSAGARVLVTESRLEALMWRLVGRVPSLERVMNATALDRDEEPVWPEVLPDDLAFLQYTSGSTRRPKGVRVTHRSLMANIDAIMGPNGGDVTAGVDTTVSWLPLYHDMGLIGFVLGPFVWGIDAVFIPTLRFLRRPQCWLDTIHRHRGTITFAPNFAYALVTRQVDPAKFDWDLSCLRLCGCGAEPIQPGTLRAFTERFAAAGLPPNAPTPAYGMAEATLAISFQRWDEPLVTRHVAGSVFREEGRVQLIAPDDTDAVEHVCCGRPFPGHGLRVVGPDGAVLADGTEGELVTQGPSNADGYFDDSESTAEAFRDGWLHTGDLGYLLDGAVTVTGRRKDLLILNGRNVHPQEVEWVVGELEGVRLGNVVAFTRPGADTEELVIALEARDADIELLGRAVRDHVCSEMGLAAQDVICLIPGALPKTSSGKLQRTRTRAQYLDGTLGTDGRAPAVSRTEVARHLAGSAWSRLKGAARDLTN